MGEERRDRDAVSVANARFRRRALLAALLAAAVLLLLAGPAGIGIGDIPAQVATLAAWAGNHPLWAGAIYFLLYLAYALLPLPGVGILSLAAGALFGLVWGTLLVSFASTLGALGAFWIARGLLRPRVERFLERRHPARLAALRQGMERDGARYLLSLRLVPVIPYFAINLAMGLAPLRSWTFYWASQVGMFPATLIYVNAGRELGRIRAPEQVLSPDLLAALLLLATLPWLVRPLAWLLRRPSGRS